MARWSLGRNGNSTGGIRSNLTKSGEFMPKKTTLSPRNASTTAPLIARRKLLRGVAALIERPIGGPNATAIISSMRDGR